LNPAAFGQTVKRTREAIANQNIRWLVPCRVCGRQRFVLVVAASYGIRRSYLNWLIRRAIEKDDLGHWHSSIRHCGHGQVARMFYGNRAQRQCLFRSALDLRAPSVSQRRAAW
jgi:hypothetical protein